MTKTHKFFAAAAIAALVTTGTGCGKIADKAAEKVTKKGIEKTIEHKTGGKVDIDTDGDGGFSYQTKDGSKYQAGSNATLPGDWPKLLAIPKGFKIITSTTSKDDRDSLSVVTAHGKGDPAKLFDTYKKRVEDAGYEIANETSMGDDESGFMKNFIAGNDQTSLHVSVSYDPDEKQVLLTLGAGGGGSDD